MGSKGIKRSFRLDPESDKLLAALARPVEGNLSLALRLAINAAAAELVAKAAPEQQPKRG